MQQRNALMLFGAGCTSVMYFVPPETLPEAIRFAGLWIGFLVLVTGALAWTFNFMDPPAIRSLDAPKPNSSNQWIVDWVPIDRISAFRLGQWAAIISGYEYPSDIHDNPGLQLWRNEFFHLKRAIGDGTFALDENRRKSVTRLTLVTRDEITRFYAANNRRVAALFPEERTRVLQQS